MFDLGAYLAGFDERLLEDAEGRRILTRLDPLLFALTYLPHHLKTDDSITFSEFHLDLIEHAKHWIVEETAPRQHRDAYVAPRDCGKSTWLFTILPIWAAAHRHRRFIAAFADSATQAERHLATFKRETETNRLLRGDFPDLCAPSRRPRGSAEADNQSLYIAKSGFVFAASGVDTKVLGLKIGTKRPDLIILDDIEPGEENYSLAQKDKRLGGILDSILPLSEFARVVMVGTVTMPDSIIHDLVRSVTIPGESPRWIGEQNFVCHYYPALITDEETGDERSVWPEKWPMGYLDSIRHTREFLKNMQNDPMGRDGEYFTVADFRYGDLPAMSACMLSIDPAVTSKARSDFTALAVVGYQPPRYDTVDGRTVEMESAKCVIRYAGARRIQVGEPLRQWVLSVLDEFPEIAGVLIESNQGGEGWASILHDLPVRLDLVHNTIPKEIRAARLATRYQTGRVLHARPFPQAEGQMVGFPKAPNDDLVDAIGNGIAVFLGKPTPIAEARQYAY